MYKYVWANKTKQNRRKPITADHDISTLTEDRANKQKPKNWEKKKKNDILFQRQKHSAQATFTELIDFSGLGNLSSELVCFLLHEAVTAVPGDDTYDGDGRCLPLPLVHPHVATWFGGRVEHFQHCSVATASPFSYLASSGTYNCASTQFLRLNRIRIDKKYENSALLRDTVQWCRTTFCGAETCKKWRFSTTPFHNIEQYIYAMTTFLLHYFHQVFTELFQSMHGSDKVSVDSLVILHWNYTESALTALGKPTFHSQNSYIGCYVPAKPSAIG